MTEREEGGRVEQREREGGRGKKIERGRDGGEV